MLLSPLQTERLLLRRLELTDAETIRLLAGDPQVAETTLTIPHPYPEGAAESFIGYSHEELETGQGYILGIERREDGAFLGVISLSGVHPVHRRAELGYWIGVPYWGKGYATEATEAILRLGFERVGLNSIYARFFTSNPGSGRVMQKAKMKYEGTLRQHLCKNGRFEDVAYYSILRSEWGQS